MRNEERFVAACLDSVLDQLESLPECEILCVDGASTDETRNIVLGYSKKEPRLRLIDNPDKIVPFGMNKAIREARGDVIIRLDCHAKYVADYLKNCVETLQRTGADNVGGYMDTQPADDSIIGRAISAAISSRFGVGGSAFRTGGGEQEADTVPFGCFRRDVFDRFGLYDERLVRNQDIELNSRIRSGGGRIIISPSIRLTYFGPSTFSRLRRQAFNNGLWNPYTLYLVGGGLCLRHLIPLFFVLSIACFGVAGVFFRPLWYLLAAEIVLYLSAAIGIAIPTARSAGVSVGLLMSSFVQLHLSYGLGSLWGVITAPFKFRKS